jgi:hypothetical protein
MLTEKAYYHLIAEDLSNSPGFAKISTWWIRELNLITETKK